MGLLFTIGAFVVAFSILVFAHEFGHFIAAKRSGIKVEEFGFGLPPRLWGKRKGETLYSINAIPFGGFVRMLGEDSPEGGGEKKLKACATAKEKANALAKAKALEISKAELYKRGFSAQSKRIQVKVLVAGVFMNFLLAWVIISVGFIIGMEPLIGPDDVFTAVDDGTITLDEGATIKSVEAGSAAEEFGFKAGDKLVAVNGIAVDSAFKATLATKGPGGVYTIVRDGTPIDIEMIWWNPLSEAEVASHPELGITYHSFLAFPRVKIYEVKKDSLAYKSGLRDSDVVIAINGEQIYSLDDYNKAVEGSNGAMYTIYRVDHREDIFVEFAASRKIIVSSVLEDRPAFSVGLKEGDIIVSVNGTLMTGAEQMINYVEKEAANKLIFLVNRKGENLYYEIKPEDGKIGVYLSELVSSNEPRDISVYAVDQFTSVLNIRDEQYPIYSAPFHAFSETFRLAGMTVGLFKDLVSQVVSTGEVPSNVAGPVGIAQMSGTFASQGVMPYFRFIALLSISLAVLNILPFPALDGGKLLFIVIEFVVGRKVPVKWENLIHLLGYLFILGLILMITYNDILRLIGL